MGATPSPVSYPDFAGRHHVDPRHGPRQVRQVCVVLGDDVFGGKVAVVDSGVRVGGEHYVIAQLQGLADSGVDAIVSLQPADDQAVDAKIQQLGLQVSLVERVWSGFSHAKVLRRSLQSFGQLPAFGTVSQLVALFFVLDEDDRDACFASLDTEVVDVLDNALDLKTCLLYTSPSPRDRTRSRMPSSA